VTNEETGAQHLFRSLRITASARFNASRRLRLHERFSLWSISLFSLGLIVFPLFKPFGIPTNYGEQVLNFVQVVAAAAILTVSILVNGSNFSERAEKMHRCALELNSLAREAELMIEEGTDKSKVIDTQRRYEEILARYENHANIDYRVAQIKKAPGFYKINWLSRLRVAVEAGAGFSPYVALIAVELMFVYYLLR
jgi:SMODS and SLOG-associating 2TM effector domain family 5